MQIERKEFKAAHVNDLDAILQNSGILDDFNNGEIKCEICSDVITKKNIGSIRKSNDKLFFACSKASCYVEVMKKVGE